MIPHVLATPASVLLKILPLFFQIYALQVDFKLPLDVSVTKRCACADEDLKSMDRRSRRTSKELMLRALGQSCERITVKASFLSRVPLLPAGSVASLHRSQVPVHHLPHHLLRGERRRVEEALQALCCSEALPPCKAAAFTLCVKYLCAH